MCQRLAGRIEEFTGKILRLGNDEAEGGAADGQPHLLHHIHQARPHDLQRDGVGLDPRHRRFDRHAGRHDRIGDRRAGDGDAKIANGIDRQHVARWDDGGGFALLHDGGARDAVAGFKRIAIPDAGIDEAFAEETPARALLFGPARGIGSGLAQGQLRLAPRDAQPEADRFHRRIRRQRGVALRVTVGEGAADGGQTDIADRTCGKRHPDLVDLANQAHIGLALHRHILIRHARFGQHRTALGLQRGQKCVHRHRIEPGIQPNGHRPHLVERQRRHQETQRRGSA